jgi:hypothetical protein
MRERFTLSATEYSPMTTPTVPTPTAPATGEPATPPPAPSGQPPTPPATGEPPAPRPDEPLGEPGKAALQAERKRASEAEKRANDLAARVKTFEDAQKSAEEKLADDLKSAQDRAAKAETALLRRDIAAKAGLPPELADLLDGDEAAMQARAELLKGHLAPPAPGSKPTRPVESLQPGTGPAPSSEPKQLTQADLDQMKPEQIVAAQAAGQLNTLLGVKPT